LEYAQPVYTHTHNEYSHREVNVIPEYWQYYIAIEQDLITASRFVEFAIQNRDTYSIEFTRILLAAASEVDVAGKELCVIADPSSKPERISDYRTILSKNFPLLPYTQIYVPRYDLTMAPWISWKEEKTPEWWSSYNNVKHHRNVQFHEATLRNALKATAGLLVILLHLYRKTHGYGVELQPLPQLLIPEEFHQDTTMYRERPKCYWKIPSDNDERFTDITTLKIQEESWAVSA
jgi:hypothetical protein